jgi:hypothetical protein
MGRTWLNRGIVIAVVAVLAGAWTVGVSGLRGSDSPSDDRPPASPESSVAPENDGPVARGNVKPPRETKKSRSKDPITEPVVDADDRPATDAPTTPPPETPDSTPDSPDVPDDPPDSPTPPTPSDPPSEPSDECTDLLSTLDCVLDPITGHP